MPRETDNCLPQHGPPYMAVYVKYDGHYGCISLHPPRIIPDLTSTIRPLHLQHSKALSGALVAIYISQVTMKNTTLMRRLIMKRKIYQATFIVAMSKGKAHD
jgi:hypothetical protein